MANKIRVKVGHIEIETETTEVFNYENLVKLLEQVVEKYNQTQEYTPPTASPINKHSSAPDMAPIAAQKEPSCTLSMENIAIKLNAKTGPDLIVAAMAYLTLVKGLDSCPAKEITKAMKTVKSIYNINMLKNIQQHFRNLMRSKLINSPEAKHYTLTNNKLSEIRSKLA